MQFVALFYFENSCNNNNPAGYFIQKQAVCAENAASSLCYDFLKSPLIDRAEIDELEGGP